MMPWDNDIVLPAIDATTYPVASGSSLLISKHHKSKDKIALPQILPGQSLKLQILIPPGVASASIRAESKQWQGGAGIGNAPAIRSCEYDAGEFHRYPLQRPSGAFGDGRIYFSDLQAVNGSLNASLYGNTSPMNAPVAEPRYAYCYFYNPLGSATFNFESIEISMLVSDTNLYSAWRNPRPWAGGTSPDVDGIDAAPMEHEVTPSNSAMILNHPQRKITGTQFKPQIRIDDTTAHANSVLNSNSHVLIDLQLDPDRRDAGKLGHYIAVAGWQDADSHADLSHAIWQQYSGHAWQAWAGATISTDGAISVPAIKTATPAVTITADTVAIDLGKLTAPAALAADGRTVVIFVGYQCQADDSDYVVLSQPLGFTVT
jgi:hypothetical protein